MSQSPPTAEEGTAREAGPEAGSSRGQRALQEARLCRGVPAPQPRPPRASGVCPWLTLYQASWNPSWHMGVGVAPGEQEPGCQSKRGWQHAEVAVPGPAGELGAGGQPRCPGVAGNLLRSSPAPDLWTQSPRGTAAGVAEPAHQVPGGTGAAHTAAPRGWASRLWVLVYTPLLPRGVPGPSPRPLPNLLRHRPAGPGAGSREPVPTASSPAASGSLPCRREARRTECTGGAGGTRSTGYGLPGRLDKQSQCHPPRRLCNDCQAQPGGVPGDQAPGPRGWNPDPRREGTAHRLLPGPDLAGLSAVGSSG